MGSHLLEVGLLKSTSCFAIILGLRLAYILRSSLSSY
jgi:hypothetical protein